MSLILDKSNLSARYSAADFLAPASEPTLIDAKHAIAQNKIMIIDGTTVLTGSFDFTKVAGSSNAENLLVLPNKDLARQYEQDRQTHFAHSEP